MTPRMSRSSDKERGPIPRRVQKEGRAAINCDFVMTAEEVNPVIRTLRQNGIEVVSLHNHGLDEEPRLFYMHFWANDDAETLAQGLRAALEQTKSATA